MAGSLDELSARRFDILIVGGGIHGAFAAWDAALRGFDVALIDRGDFGGATSANSLKIVHGGFRYLQRLNFARLRRSDRERAILLRMAPHLVRPLACVAPLSGRALRSRSLAKIALQLNAAITRNRNHGLPDSRHIPDGRLLDRGEYRHAAGPFALPQAAGGILWYDAQLTSPDRLLIAIIRSAAREGACVRNYVAAVELLRDDDRVLGARVAHGDEMAEVRARLVLLASNDAVAPLLDGVRVRHPRANQFAKACNVVLAAPSHVNAAVAIPAWSGKRFLFAVPWRDRLLLGTSQHDAAVSNSTALAELLAAAQRAVPDAALGMQHVLMLHHGYLPGRAERLRDTADVRDHESKDDVAGLVSLLGTKWTTARHTAERAIDVCARRLGRSSRTDLPFARPVGSGYVSLEDLSNDSGTFPEYRGAQWRGLYGSVWREVVTLAQRCPQLAGQVGASTTIAAQIVHASRFEYAQRLDDIVLRRTELGSAGPPGDAELRSAATIAAGELGWDARRTEDEIARVHSYYRL